MASKKQHDGKQDAGQGERKRRDNRHAERRTARRQSFTGLTFRAVFIAFTVTLSVLAAAVGTFVGARLAVRTAAVVSVKATRSLPDLKLALGFGFTFAVLLATLACLLLVRRLVLDRLDAVVRHIRRVARSPDNIRRIGRIVPGTFEIKEVIEVMAAVNDGLAEMELRTRIRSLARETSEQLAKVEEEDFLPKACALFKGTGDVQEVRAYVARMDVAGGSFLIERQSEKKETRERGGSGAVGAGMGAHVQSHIQELLSHGNISEMRSEAVVQFLKSGESMEWQGNTIFQRTNLTPGGEVSLVTVVTPEVRLSLTSFQFEHLCAMWASEVARAWHQIRFQDFASSLEISQQLQRKWVQNDRGTPATASAGLSSVGFENLPSRFINGDFLCVFRLENRNASIVILGDVTGHELRAGLAATGCVAALSDRFSMLAETATHVLLDGLMNSLNRYMWASHRGALGLRTIGISFNHETGQASLCCFGQPFPYVLSPLERKPMVLVPAVNPGMMGIAESIDTTPTPFTLLPGQILFTCTEGILATEDVQGKRFEKMIQHGVLADVCQQNPQAEAQALLERFLDAVRSHAGSTNIRNDLTAVILKVTLPTH